jgi:DNA polymerase-1
MSKLVLIDGNAIMHRAFHALPKTLTTRNGEPINAVYGFVSMLFKIITDLEPTHIAVCFDRKEPTFRKKEFADYQAHRPETDKGLLEQFPKAKKIVSAFGIPIYEKAGYEADDVIGTIAQRATSHTGKRRKSKKSTQENAGKVSGVVIVTGDKDIFQLINDKVKVYCPVKGLSQAQLMGEMEVVEKLGISPSQIIDYKALVGDPSDNYKGVPGVGPKTAESLLKNYGNFSNVYKNIEKIGGNVAKKLKEGEKSGKQSYMLAQIVTDVPVDFDIEDTSKWSMGNSKTLRLFDEFGFRSLKKRMLAISGRKINENPSIEEIKRVVLKLAKLFRKKQYAIRGTTSLVLQEVEMNVDDIDIICDKKTAFACNQLLKKYQFEEVEFKESDKFKSYFGKFVIDGVLVEIMGEWQIKIAKSSNLPAGKAGFKVQSWGKKYDANPEQIMQTKIGKEKVNLTTIETELDMFSQMGRWTAYHKIKKQMEEKNQGRLF